MTSCEFVIWEIRANGGSMYKEDAEERISELLNLGWWPVNMSPTIPDEDGTIFIITLLARPLVIVTGDPDSDDLDEWGEL